VPEHAVRAQELLVVGIPRQILVGIIVVVDPEPGVTMADAEIARARRGATGGELGDGRCDFCGGDRRYHPPRLVAHQHRVAGTGCGGEPLQRGLPAVGEERG